MDLKSKTIDELQELLSDVRNEITERNKEPTKTVYVVRLNDWDDCSNWYKDFNEAKKYLVDEADENNIVECKNKVSIGTEEIPSTEYDLRPDIWYG